MTVYILVDDEPDIETLFRQQFQRDLRAGRFQMAFARSPLAAMARAVDIGDPSRVLTLPDINMPSMSGVEMLPVITAYGDAGTRKKAIERGAVGLLPIDFAQLRREIDTRLEQTA